MEKLISAAEARELLEERYLVVKKLNELIKTACEKGHHWVEYDFGNPYLIKYLREQGYVRVSRTYFSWDGEDGEVVDWGR